MACSLSHNRSMQIISYLAILMREGSSAMGEAVVPVCGLCLAGLKPTIPSDACD